MEREREASVIEAWCGGCFQLENLPKEQDTLLHLNSGNILIHRRSYTMASRIFT